MGANCMLKKKITVMALTLVIMCSLIIQGKEEVSSGGEPHPCSIMTSGIANGQSQPITVVYINQRRKKAATEGNKV